MVQIHSPTTFLNYLRPWFIHPKCGRPLRGRLRCPKGLRTLMAESPGGPGFEGATGRVWSESLVGWGGKARAERARWTSCRTALPTTSSRHFVSY